MGLGLSKCLLCSHEDLGAKNAGFANSEGSSPIRSMALEMTMEQLLGILVNSSDLTNCTAACSTVKPGWGSGLSSC